MKLLDAEEIMALDLVAGDVDKLFAYLQYLQNGKGVGAQALTVAVSANPP